MTPDPPIPAQSTSTTPSPAEPSISVQSTFPVESPRLLGSNNNVEESITPAQVHWVDISGIDSFTVQNVVGTVFITLGMLAIALEPQVNSRSAIIIPSFIFVVIGLVFYIVSYMVTLRGLKKKKRPLN